MGKQGPFEIHCVSQGYVDSVGFGGLLRDVDFSCPAFSVISCRSSRSSKSVVLANNKENLNHVCRNAYEHGQGSGHIFGAKKCSPPFKEEKNKNQQLN